MNTVEKIVNISLSAIFATIVCFIANDLSEVDILTVWLICFFGFANYLPAHNSKQS
jgi:hypothetical protein